MIRYAGTIAVAALAAIVFSSPGTTAARQDTLRVEVELVTVVATVTDAQGRYVSGLMPDDFVVEDNGVAQQIVDFSSDQNIPVSLGIILDTSASMTRRMRTALSAIDRFIGTLAPDDDVFLATFSGRTSLLEDFTSDRDKLSRALTRVREAGQTALYDGLSMALEKVHDGVNPKRAILLVTDGADGASETTLNSVSERLEQVDVLVYGLGIEPVRSDAAAHVEFDWPVMTIPGARSLGQMPALDQPVDMNVLRRFASASGGRAFAVSGTWTDGTIDDVDRILDEVAAELRSQYTLTYYPSFEGAGVPTPEGRGSRYHQIRVRVAGSDYTVRARDGYTTR